MIIGRDARWKRDGPSRPVLRTCHPAAKPWLSKVVLLVLLPLSFDYRAQAADTLALTIQSVELALSLVGLIIALSKAGRYSVCSTNVVITGAALIFISVALGSGFASSEPPMPMLAAVTPIVCFLSAAWSIAVMLDVDGAIPVGRAVLVSSSALIVFKAVFGFLYYRVNFEDVRFQILSGATIYVSSYTITRIWCGAKPIVFPIMIVNAALIALSVTRTQIACILIMLAVACLLGLGPLFRPSVLKRLLILTVLASLFLAAATVIGGGLVASRWVERGEHTRSDIDLTKYTRIAETHYQWESTFQSVGTALFGNGLLAKSAYTGDAADELVRRLGPTILLEPGFGFGHNFFVGLLFTGGLVGGGAVILALVHGLFRCVRPLIVGLHDDRDGGVVLSMVLAYVGYMLYGTIGGTWADRSISLYFGVAVGGLAWAVRRLQYRKPVRRRLAI